MMMLGDKPDCGASSQGIGRPVDNHPFRSYVQQGAKHSGHCKRRGEFVCHLYVQHTGSYVQLVCSSIVGHCELTLHSSFQMKSKSRKHVPTLFQVIHFGNHFGLEIRIRCLNLTLHLEDKDFSMARGVIPNEILRSRKEGYFNKHQDI